MSSHDRKLLKEFYRYFPVVVIEVGGDRAIDRRHSQTYPYFKLDDRFVPSLSNLKSQISKSQNPQSKIPNLKSKIE
ncbi:MAG: hypothetical protein JGK17_18545 [Microcoleus sp. PH2017_10_PVI_O_A]|uniref:hypothetical protein n=1 Tax=unclassified Microcoleus TaxID=2642155 RepID=UPI001E0575D1|nr:MULTISPECIES: hypothetical protein [unclassified Microcoleus]TAE77821.1 MAG: hypothetical protein EAZ83_25730 [Oscillatoriales cyanobacterium]MCC3407553.1 hypothetical protein [Microcoleus sp. PH2017_10_PVI_O_A]MCC3461728.1 hypothetical protein [Microcoleus sp. PH2017_11_PCY_U_A]MCC3481499.1 hypothetical protein [Microcoleus sp. PH2017_12_PCY_D_A]MCC3529189.1 hypothetical protein [Microcoleus sp. PH2017_21_RUC_O_A]